MSSFFPDGYVPTPEAILEVAEKWFGQRLREVETLVASELASKAEPKSGVEALARALSQPPIPAPLLQLYEDIVPQIVVRLRNHLFDGKLLTVYYFGGLLDGRHEVSPGFWATPQADGVLESGAYYPFGKPGRWYERPLICPIFFQRAELTTLLSVQQSSKKQLPESKKADLEAALRKFNDLSREQQRKMVGELPAFQPYHITDAVFREAAKKAPRPRGRPKSD